MLTFECFRYVICIVKVLCFIYCTIYCVNKGRWTQTIILFACKERKRGELESPWLLPSPSIFSIAESVQSTSDPASYSIKIHPEFYLIVFILILVVLLCKSTHNHVCVFYTLPAIHPPVRVPQTSLLCPLKVKQNFNYFVLLPDMMWIVGNYKKYDYIKLCVM